MAGFDRQTSLVYGTGVERVTVVIPFFNRSSYFPRLLESLNSQTIKPFQVLIVDNGSAESEIEAIWGCIKNIYSFQITLVSTLKSGNANIARNLGFLLASTEFVAFLDSDDYWCSNHLEKCLEHVTELRNQRAGNIAIYCSSKIIYESFSAVIPSRQITRQENVYQFLLGFGHGFAQSSGFFVSSSLGQFALWDETLPRMQDIDFFISVSAVTTWIYSLETTVVIDWEQNRCKPINFDGFIKFYLKHEGKMPLSVKTRFLLFSIKECVVRSGEKDVFRLFKLHFSNLSIFHKIISTALLHRSLIKAAEKILHYFRKVIF